MEELKIKGIRNFEYVKSKGNKWKHRNIPIYIRENLMIPFYYTIIEGKEYIYIMTLPKNQKSKVFFEQYLIHK